MNLLCQLLLSNSNEFNSNVLIAEIFKATVAWWRYLSNVLWIKWTGSCWQTVQIFLLSSLFLFPDLISTAALIPTVWHTVDHIQNLTESLFCCLVIFFVTPGDNYPNLDGMTSLIPDICSSTGSLGWLLDMYCRQSLSWWRNSRESRLKKWLKHITRDRKQPFCCLIPSVIY